MFIKFRNKLVVVNMRDVKKLFETLVMIYNKEEYRKTWKKQSPESRDLLESRIVSGGTERAGKEIHPVVRFSV